MARPRSDNWQAERKIQKGIRDTAHRYFQSGVAARDRRGRITNSPQIIAALKQRMLWLARELVDAGRHVEARESRLFQTLRSAYGMDPPGLLADYWGEDVDRKYLTESGKKLPSGRYSTKRIMKFPPEAMRLRNVEIALERAPLIHALMLALHDHGAIVDKGCPRLALQGWGGPISVFEMTPQQIEYLANLIIDDRRLDRRYIREGCAFLLAYARSWKAEVAFDDFVYRIAPDLERPGRIDQRLWGALAVVGRLSYRRGGGVDWSKSIKAWAIAFRPKRPRLGKRPGPYYRRDL